MKPANPLHAADWAVGPIEKRVGMGLIARYHYAKTAGDVAVAMHGLMHRESWQVLGCTLWMPPTRTAATAFWPDPDAVLALSRLVIAPNVPTNAATFLLMRSVKLLPPQYRCLVTWADTYRGHTGGIYRAAGWEYLGLTEPDYVWERDGVLISRRTPSKGTYTNDQMRAQGCELVTRSQKHRFRLVRATRRTQSTQATQLDLLAAFPESA